MRGERCSAGRGGSSRPRGGLTRSWSATPRRRGSASRCCARSPRTRPGSTRRRRAELRQERERLRHVTELAAAASAAATALAPDDGEGAVGLTARAGHELGSVSAIAAELAPVSAELRECEVRLAEAASAVRAFLASLDADPGRLEHVEAELERYADLRRTYRAETTDELVERAAAARAELDSLDAGADPVEASARALESRGARSRGHRSGARRLAPRARRRRSRPPSQRSSAGSAWGRASSRSSCRNAKPSPPAGDDVRFLVRPNAGPAARAGQRDRIGRRALPHRACDRRRRGRRDDGVRRDRRGRGRRDGARGRGHARPPRGDGHRSSRSPICRRSRAAPTGTSPSRRCPGDPTHTRIRELTHGRAA